MRPRLSLLASSPISTHPSLLLCFVFIFLLTSCNPDPTAEPRVSNNGLAVARVFQNFYDDHGGGRVLGDPVSAEIEEAGLRIQYFQNARLEYHPQLPEGRQVILSSLGKSLYGLTPCLLPENVLPNALYFETTCHSVSPQFREFFERYGGVSFFGYPISEMYISGGRFVQHFERAVIIWDSGKPAEVQFGLAGLGSYICPEAVCRAGPRTFIADTPTPSPEPTPSDVISRFYDLYNGQRLFGGVLDERRTGDDGADERVYERAILYENPAAPEGVSLRPLGLKALGTAEPPALQTDAPNSIYFDKYGHNVTGVFYEFFNANGGVNVLGLPISEARVENGNWVQYFENAVIVWRSGLAGDRATQLLSLGQQSLIANSANNGAVVRTAPPQMLIVETSPVYTIYPVNDGEPQTLKASVTDENGWPVAGASLVFIVRTPGGEQRYAVNATDANGAAAVSFALSSYKIGDFITYNATATYDNLTASKGGQFVPWGTKP